MTIEKDPACESLESIEIPQGITEIYDNTFRCTGLKSMVIPDGVMTIGSDSFAYCESLESVVIPESVLYINSFRLYIHQYRRAFLQNLRFRHQH